MSRQSSTKARQPQGKQPVQPSKQSPQTPMKKRSEPALGWSMKKFWRRNWLWVLGIGLILLIGLGSWYSSSRSPSSPPATPQATEAATNSAIQTTPTAQVTSTPMPITPEATGNWRMVQTFTGSDTGNAAQKMQTFTVANNWQITWACQGQKGVVGWLYIAIYNAGGTLYNAGAQVTCIAAKQVIGSVAEPQSGTFYLAINASVPWTVTVQVQK